MSSTSGPSYRFTTIVFSVSVGVTAAAEVVAAAVAEAVPSVVVVAAGAASSSLPTSFFGRGRAVQRSAFSTDDSSLKQTRPCSSPNFRLLTNSISPYCRK
uniref:Secreted protein n=1 Tax=Anopheles darlingi TaxID=43151 RepID=A0A2M4D3Q6_ANODA